MELVTLEQCQKRCEQCELGSIGRDLCAAYNTTKAALSTLFERPDSPEREAEVSRALDNIWSVSIVNAVHVGLVRHGGDVLAVLQSIQELLMEYFRHLDAAMKALVTRETLAGVQERRAMADQATTPERLH